MLTFTNNSVSAMASANKVYLTVIGLNQTNRVLRPRYVTHNTNDLKYQLQYTGQSPVSMSLSGEFITAREAVMAPDGRDLVPVAEYDKLNEWARAGQIVEVKHESDPTKPADDLGEALIVSITERGDVMGTELLTQPWQIQLAFLVDKGDPIGKDPTGAGPGTIPGTGAPALPGLPGGGPVMPGPLPPLGPGPQPQPASPAVLTVAVVGGTTTRVPGHLDVWSVPVNPGPGIAGPGTPAALYLAINPAPTVDYDIDWERYDFPTNQWLSVFTEMKSANQGTATRRLEDHPSGTLEWWRCAFTPPLPAPAGATGTAAQDTEFSNLIGVYWDYPSDGDGSDIDVPPGGPRPTQFPLRPEIRIVRRTHREVQQPSGMVLPPEPHWLPVMLAPGQSDVWVVPGAMDPDTGHSTSVEIEASLVQAGEAARSYKATFQYWWWYQRDGDVVDERVDPGRVEFGERRWKQLEAPNGVDAVVFVPPDPPTSPPQQPLTPENTSYEYVVGFDVTAPDVVRPTIRMPENYTSIRGEPEYAPYWFRVRYEVGRQVIYTQPAGLFWGATPRTDLFRPDPYNSSGQVTTPPPTMTEVEFAVAQGMDITMTYSLSSMTLTNATIGIVDGDGDPLTALPDGWEMQVVGSLPDDLELMDLTVSGTMDAARMPGDRSQHVVFLARDGMTESTRRLIILVAA